MSDADEGSFDKEAEKEKLREQLRREEENRRSTQHMSELLLKGATMTNKHCDTCGDPLFRYEGQEFCPTCSQAGEDTTAEGAAEAGTEGGIDRVGGADQSAAGGATDESAADGDGSGAEDGDRVLAGAGTSVTETGATAPTATEPVTTPTEGSGDVAAARASLLRKLTALARRAEETEDVARSRELLAAAREAAEALAAVDSLRG